MASSSAPVSVFDEHRFRKEFNQELFNSHSRKRKVILEVGFNLNEDEYPQIMEQVMLRGWRRLAAPRTNVSELMVQDFYANAAISDEEAAEQDELPYKSFVRGIKVDFSPSNIRRVMRFKREIAGAQTNYKTRQAVDQRLDEVLADLCIQGATWKLSSGKPAVPIQLRRTELYPLAKGWQEFIIHSLVPTGNKLEVTTARAILIHCIMQGEEVRVEDIIADNIATIAQGLTNKGKLAYPSTTYKLCKDAGVPLREFRRTPRIPKLSYVTARRMEATRYPRNLPRPQQDDGDEDEPMPQADGGNEEEEDQQQPQQDQQPPQHGFPDFQPQYQSQFHETLEGIESHLSSMQFFQQNFYENMEKSQADYMEEVKQIKAKQEEIWTNNQRFQSQYRQEQERLAKEIQEVRKSQITQTLANNKRLETEKNMQLAIERQGRDIVEMRKQLNLWTSNDSAREAYTCWAHQQANPNLSEIPITQIPDVMQTNAEKRRPMFYGCLKSDYGQPLPHKLILKSRYRCGQHLLLPVSIHHILHLISHKALSTTPRRPRSHLWKKPPTPRRGCQRLGVTQQPQGFQGHSKPTSRRPTQCLGDVTNPYRFVSTPISASD
ncbi:hypothetical protein PIB30_081403 [Stylosanthes scabra]|uniref:Putative plant transposon protein domain-containing protein n=1 Tax=Stylosanthes scabra TaxID=79078 RepID=A0ABU6SRX9_9FABA|nr:hypothetical protein [Stylosanthes scabra]